MAGDVAAEFGWCEECGAVLLITHSVIYCPACRERWLEEHRQPGSHNYAVDMLENEGGS